MQFRHLVLMVLPALCFTAGCDKKSTPSKVSTTPLPKQVTETSRSLSEDSAQVFDKYYKDSPAATDKKTEETFSMNSPESYVPRFSSRGRYVIQVASMGNATLAEELATELKEKGYPAYVAQAENPTNYLNGTYFRVRIGNFAAFSDAKAFGENILVPGKYEYWIDKKINETSSASFESGSTYTPSTTSPATKNSFAPAAWPSGASPVPPSTVSDQPSDDSNKWRSDTASGW